MIIKRLIAFILDLVIIAIIMNVILFATQTIDSPILLQLLSALIVTLLLCKDCINGQSVGKKIMKIQVVDKKSKTEISNIRSIVRNAFVIFWIIEIMVLFISKDKRIGDYIVKSEVIGYDKIKKTELNRSTLYAILICFCFVFALLFIVYNLLHSSIFQLLF